MNELEKDDYIKILEKQLKDEKRFRKTQNDLLVWEKERNQIEVRGLKDVLMQKFREIQRLKKQLKGKDNGTDDSQN